jgi:hypothetical protein
MCLLASRIHSLLIRVYELQNMIQCFFASQLFLEVASFLDAVWFQAFQIAYSVAAMPNNFARSAFAPILRVRARTACYMTSSFSRKQIHFGIAFTSATFVFPRTKFRHVLLIRCLYDNYFTSKANYKRFFYKRKKEPAEKCT